MIKKRKTPLRKCTGCQEMKNKKELIRVVRSPEGEFSLDSTGKKSGRGAYVCLSVECFNTACKKKGFERSFKQALPSDVLANLQHEVANLPKLQEQ